MPVSHAEQQVRTLVNGLRDQITVPTVPGADVIRREALSTFTAALDGKIANLQDGETLQITFRVDIIGQNGTVRGGSGAERNMPEYISWRHAVFTRDGYTCQECKSQINIEAHHVKTWAAYPALRFDVANGLTLCKRCHAEKHPYLKAGCDGSS